MYSMLIYEMFYLFIYLFDSHNLTSNRSGPHLVEIKQFPAGNLAGPMRPAGRVFDTPRRYSNISINSPSTM